MPHPTTDDLKRALHRYDTEAIPGEWHTGRYRQRYVTWGDGPTVLIVHGLCDMPRSFAMLMEELVNLGYRCLAYDLANGKDDDAFLGRYRHEDFVDDLVALLDHQQLSQVDIMGSSFGSTITLHGLVRHPTRFRKAVLQGGFARRPIMRIERGLSRLGRYWPWRMNQLPIRKKVMEKLEAAQFVGCPPEVYDFLIECSGETPVRAAARRGLILDKLDLRPRLPEITQPLLLIGGDRDVLVPLECEQAVLKGVPHAQRIEFTPCGHYPQYTMPKPMAEAMHQFYRS